MLFLLHTILIGDVIMDTNKVLIGNVYQIIKWKENTFDIDYSYCKLKENALLFKQSDNTYLDIETKLSYEVNVNPHRQIGDAFVFSENLIPFNQYLDENYRCNDIDENDIIKVYQNVKSDIEKQNN